MTQRLPKSAPVWTELTAAVHDVATDLAKWLHGQFFRQSGKNWWDHHVCGLVVERDQQRIDDGEWKELEDLDLGALLNLLKANYRFLNGKNALGKDSRDTISAMTQLRNRCEGHWPLKGIPLDEVVMHINALQEFSKMIGGGKTRNEQIASLRKSVEHFESTSPSPSSDAAAAPDLSPMIPPNGKRLADYFGTEQLTESQTKAVNSLQRFLEDPDERCFILRGYAGTGKTFLIGGLVRYLQEVHRKPLMMAPTGRAAHVLRDRHHVEASTIHRTIYSLTALKDYRELDESGDITYKFYFDLKNNDIDHDTVFIVDEASMISDSYLESEFMHFGSGRLLSDLLRFINFDGNDYRKKLILVGDNAQLPPFGASAALPSPALDADYLLQKRRIKCSNCELTDVVRQLDSSPILKNATEMRRMLQEDRFQKFDFVADGVTVREFPLDEFIETFVREREAESFTSTVIVAYKNATTKTYNEAVRARLFPGIESLTAKDQIIVVRNNYNYERALLNGQMGLVVATDDRLETRSVPLNVGLDDEGKRKIETIKLQFRNATLRFSDDQGNPFDVTCKISEDCLLNGLSDLPSLYSKALYVDFQKRNPRLKPGQAEFKEALKADPYFNAVMIKFGYAITCHKAQGGEWRTVFVDFSGMDKLNAESMRWSYTALTRAESSIVATNALHHHILKPKKIETRQAKGEKVAALPENDADGLPTDPQPAIPASPSEAIRGLMDEALPSGWEISTSRKLPYQERFTLVASGDIVTISVYYNSKERISKVSISSTPGKQELDEKALKAFGPLKGRKLGHTGNEKLKLVKEHEEFAERLRAVADEIKIHVISLESKSQYHLVACLKAGSEEGEVNYYFDKYGGFTRFMSQPNCPQEIIDLLEKIHV
jgi:hypothetical protein